MTVNPQEEQKVHQKIQRARSTQFCTLAHCHWTEKTLPTSPLLTPNPITNLGTSGQTVITFTAPSPPPRNDLPLHVPPIPPWTSEQDIRPSHSFAVGAPSTRLNELPLDVTPPLAWDVTQQDVRPGHHIILPSFAPDAHSHVSNKDPKPPQNTEPGCTSRWTLTSQSPSPFPS